jgi:hypothetical protein
MAAFSPGNLNGLLPLVASLIWYSRRAGLRIISMFSACHGSQNAWFLFFPVFERRNFLLFRSLIYPGFRSHSYLPADFLIYAVLDLKYFSGFMCTFHGMLLFTFCVSWILFRVQKKRACWVFDIPGVSVRAFLLL